MSNVRTYILIANSDLLISCISFTFLSYERKGVEQSTRTIFLILMHERIKMYRIRNTAFYGLFSDSDHGKSGTVMNSASRPGVRLAIDNINNVLKARYCT